MLLSAKFENIYSFNEETRILFTASKSDQLPLQVSRAEKRDDISVLRMGLIYGANASGKSNMFGYYQGFCLEWLERPHVQLLQDDGRTSRAFKH